MAEAEKNLSVRADSRVQRQIEQLVREAEREGLTAQGCAHRVRVKASHITRLALRAGLPLVMAALRAENRRAGG
jgi:hypothetical protein